MAILFRLFFISLLVYLVWKLIRDFMSGPKEEEKKVKTSVKDRKVSKEAGEYVEFEEVKKDKGQTTKDKGKRVSDKDRGTRDYR